MTEMRCIGGRHTQVKPWDVDDATWSEASMARVLRALVQVRGWFTDAFMLGHPEYRSGRDSVFMRVWIPEGAEQAFQDLARATLKPAPQITTGGRQIVCAACGRKFDAPRDVVRPEEPVPACSQFCAGRLAEREHRAGGAVVGGMKDAQTV